MTLAAGRTLAAGAGLAAAVYGLWVRPRLMRWGATDDEATGPYPGAGGVPEGQRAGTMAVTIEAPPEEVWPWLVQMGWNRGGWYSWDRLDNAGHPSATQVHPEWQGLAVGDHVQGRSPGGLLAPWEVAALEPNRFLGLHKLTDLRGRGLDPRQPRPPACLEGLWGFRLKEMPGGRTRLVIGGYQAVRPGGSNGLSSPGHPSRLSGSCRHARWPCGSACRRSAWMDRSRWSPGRAGGVGRGNCTGLE